MSFGTDPFDVRRVDNEHWETLNDLRYSGRLQNFMVPRGFVTDFASVPRFLYWLFPATGAWTLAAVLHDWMCKVAVPLGYVPARDADGIFRRVMRELGVSWLTRWFMWAGVRWGAAFNGTRRPGLLRDLPLVLLISVVALPVIVPATVGVTVGYVLYGLLRGLTGLVGR